MNVIALDISKDTADCHLSKNNKEDTPHSTSANQPVAGTCPAPWATDEERSTTMADDRRLKVLSAIVTDYVRTREPVGSRALAERYRLGVSPATIRNDMVALEDEGYIH